MREKKKMPVTFYQLAPNVIGDDTFDEVVDRIKRLINAEQKGYVEQEPAKDDFGEFKVRVFHASKTAIPKWRPFISNLVVKDSTINKCRSSSQSFFLFVSHRNRIFAVTGGRGSFDIDPFVSQTFGMDIVTRLIEKNSPVIKSLQNRGVTGTLLGQKKHFRTDRRLADENLFGQIYKELSVELDKEILTSVFGFKAIELKRKTSRCLAKSSFRISKSLDKLDFFKVITKFNLLLDKPANFSINSAELISRKKHASLVAKLEETRLNLLYQSCLNNEDPDFDFVHKDMDKYLQADYYRISIGEDVFEFDEPPTLLEIQSEFRSKNRLLLDDVYQFKYAVLAVLVESVDEDGNVLTRGTIESHLNGEVSYDGRSYFIIDGEWYWISSKFIDELNNELGRLLEQHWDKGILTVPFDVKMDEGTYNLSFIGAPQTLVFDTVVPENIEACDIFKYTADSLYLIHVKKGFNNMIRDLSAQVLIAAKRLQHDRKTGYSYLEMLESITKAGKNSTSDLKRKLAEQTFPGDGLPGLFVGKRDKQICFCLAFADIGSKPRNLKDNLASFRSNIAKYALLELIKEINTLGFDFKVIQLDGKETNVRNMGKALGIEPAILATLK